MRASFAGDPIANQNRYEQLLQMRFEWEQEWRDISRYILSERGIYSRYIPPHNKIRHKSKSINTTGTEAIDVLASIMQGGLFSPARPWFKYEFANPELMSIDVLRDWITEAEKAMYSMFHQSNFYNKAVEMLIELIGFGTGYFYIGGDTKYNQTIRFDSMTAGECVVAQGFDGLVNELYRVIFFTYEQLKDRFGEENVSENAHHNYHTAGSHLSPLYYVPVLHSVVPLEVPTSAGFLWSSTYQEIGISASGQGLYHPDSFLDVGGYYTFPYLCPRWETISSNVYGNGRGAKALPRIKELQEQEKAYQMAVHRAANPPLNAPQTMKGRVRNLPGGISYYQNPQMKVEELYKGDIFDFNAILTGIERKENHIKEIFYNDLFMTLMRDPNASPLRTGEVNKKDEESLLRIGPVIERLGVEFLIPLMNRTFDIGVAKGKIPPFPQEYADFVSGINVNFISVLAQAQKLITARPIMSFIQFVGAAAQYKPEVLDKVDWDESIEEFGAITGVPQSLVVGDDKVTAIRKERAEQQAALQKEQRDLAAQQLGIQERESQAKIAKDMATASSQMSDTMAGAENQLPM